MTEDILKLIQRNYELRKDRKNHVIQLIAQIQQLNKNESVKKYLDLLDELGSIDYIGILNTSEEKMLEYSFKSHMHLINETNEIYLCLGAYMLDRKNDLDCAPADVKLNYDDSNVEYKMYINIENNTKIKVPINESKNFEETHNVIFTDQLQTRKVCDKIQIDFIKTSVEEDQNKACEKVLSKKW